MFMKSNRVLEIHYHYTIFLLIPFLLGIWETLITYDEFLQYPKVILKFSIAFPSDKHHIFHFLVGCLCFPTPSEHQRGNLGAITASVVFL